MHLIFVVPRLDINRIIGLRRGGQTNLMATGVADEIFVPRRGVRWCGVSQEQRTSWAALSAGEHSAVLQVTALG